MDRRVIKARMIADLAHDLESYFGHQFTPSTRAFYDSISGKEVELVFIHDDAFEKKDFDHWLPNHTWTEIDA